MSNKLNLQKSLIRKDAIKKLDQASTELATVVLDGQKRMIILRVKLESEKICIRQMRVGACSHVSSNDSDTQLLHQHKWHVVISISAIHHLF